MEDVSTFKEEHTVSNLGFVMGTNDVEGVAASLAEEFAEEFGELRDSLAEGTGTDSDVPVRVADPLNLIHQYPESLSSRLDCEFQPFIRSLCNISEIM